MSSVHFLLNLALLAIGAQQIFWPQGQWALQFYSGANAPNPEWLGTLQAFGGVMVAYSLAAFGFRAIGKLIAGAVILFVAYSIRSIPPSIVGILTLVSGVLELSGGNQPPRKR